MENKVYILRIPNIGKYDAMLRDQGYADYISYLEQNQLYVQLIDLKEKGSLKDFHEIQLNSKVIISIMRTEQIDVAIKIARHLKLAKKSIIIFGKLINYGAFSTPHLDCLKYNFIDYVIPPKCGETAVFKYLQSDSSYLIKNYKNETKTLKNAEEIKLTDLTPSVRPRNVEFLTYELSRGCSNRCYYCTNSRYKLQYKNIDLIISEIKTLSKIHKTNKLVFVGPEVNFDNNYLDELIEKLIPLNIQWTSYAVARKLPKEMLSKMRLAGCRMLSFGIESASQNILDSLGKKTNVHEISNILKNCGVLGIKTQMHVIIGFPNETIEDIYKLKEFIKNHSDCITNINISDLVAPKDSAIGNNPEYWGIVLNKSEKGEFFPFYEKGRSLNEKQKEVKSRINELNSFIDELQVSRFNICTTFDESFEKLYLDALNLNKVYT